MKPSKEERDLDERIRSAIGTEEVTFDFDKWKAGHQHQIERFKASVSRESAEPAQVSTWLIIVKSRLTKFAAAAVVIAAIGILLYPKEPSSVVERPRTARVEKAPAELLTMMSLNLAYRQGGMEAVDKQYEKAFKRTGPRPVKLTVEDLFAELNGG
jgi:hypothetical protein